MRQNDCFKDTDDSILQIANAVGYENGSKFTSTFKDSIGMTPSDSARYNYILHISLKIPKTYSFGLFGVDMQNTLC